MTVRVKFFASIRERVGRDTLELALASAGTPLEAWRRATDLPWQTNTLVAVNCEYARADQSLADGDEVAFFPPVTGG